MNATFTINPEFSGIEITFPGKPSEEIRENLKSAGFRWHNVKRIWYAKENPARLALAHALTNSAESAEKSETVKASPAPVLPSLWDRTRTDKIPAYGTENAVKSEIRAICTEKGWRYERAAADYFRKVLKARFPEMKFSVTSGGAGYLDHVNVKIQAGPYSMETVKGDPDAWDWRDRQDKKEPSPELAAVLNYADKLYKAADADDGDYYADYGARHELYGGVELSYEYKETEQDENTVAEIMNFRRMLADEERAKEDRLEQESAAAVRQINAEQDERELFSRAHAEYCHEIESAVVVEDLNESEQIAFTNLRGGYGKEDSAESLRDRIEDPENIKKHDAIVSRKVTFADSEMLRYFERNFLEDWSFLAGKGGTRMNDARLKSSEDFHLLTAEQRESVSIYMADCVGIYDGETLKYIVDPEGYTYARYVYVESDETERIPAPVYEGKIEAESLEKPEIYIPAPLKEQIEAANLNEGDEITILRVDPWTMGAAQTSGKLLKLTAQRYAQYEDAAELDFIPKGKRNGRRLYFTPNGETLIYKGILPEIPDALKYRRINENMSEALFAGMNSKEFLKTVIEWHKAHGYEPLIDTFQR